MQFEDFIGKYQRKSYFCGKYLAMEDEMRIIKFEKQLSNLYEHVFTLQASIDRFPIIILTYFLLGLIVGFLL